MMRSVLFFSILPGRLNDFVAAELHPLLAADPVPRLFEVVEDVTPWEDGA